MKNIRFGNMKNHANLFTNTLRVAFSSNLNYSVTKTFVSGYQSRQPQLTRVKSNKN